MHNNHLKSKDNDDKPFFFISSLFTISVILCVYVGIQKEQKNYELICNDQIMFTKINKVKIEDSGTYTFFDKKDNQITYNQDKGSICYIKKI